MTNGELLSEVVSLARRAYIKDLFKDYETCLKVIDEIDGSLTLVKTSLKSSIRKEEKE